MQDSPAGSHHLPEKKSVECQMLVSVFAPEGSSQRCHALGLPYSF